MRLIHRLLLITIVSLFSCLGSDPDLSETNPRIKKELEYRRHNYRIDKFELCAQQAMDMAIIYIDSIIANQISFQLSDSIVFPPKPEKPPFEGPIVIKDSIDVKPIFTDTLSKINRISPNPSKTN